MTKKNKIVYIIILLVGVVILNFLSNSLYKRFDLTKDDRYTLSNTSKDIIHRIENPLIIDIFLQALFNKDVDKK